MLESENMHSTKRPGQVVTFYSFKGGVGRTMALANIAFLAANSGQRVLVMDWDLEAPGLAYYFRGLVDPTTLGKAKESEGILHILWDWVREVKETESKKNIERTIGQFKNGISFDERTVRLLDYRHLPDNGCLDYIGTGSGASINAPDPTTYENALARFPWNDFFGIHAGGFVSESLREWARREYDLILIDSRTGLAEAAGICTMQLADRVAMCFLLNRQNIDGVARVSAAIRQARANDVKLFAVPMRVAREGTAEESEARARAASELHRIGGFSLEELQHQLQALSIKQAENVPFYETISQITAEDPALDPLTLNYARLAKELTGQPFSINDIDNDWLHVIRARLKPGFATKEFIEKLSGAEPLRGIEELNRLLAGAQEHISEGNDLEKDYVLALVQATLIFSNGQFAYEAHELRGSCLDLLRMLWRRDADGWQTELIRTINLHLTAASAYLDEGEELALLEELDSLLVVDPSIESRLRRVASKKRVAELYGGLGEIDLAMHTNTEGVNQISEMITSPLRILKEQQAELQILEVDFSLQRALLLEQADSSEDALDAFNECIAIAARNIGSADDTGNSFEMAASASEAHARIALLQSERILPAERASHAIESVRNNNSPFANARFVDLGLLLLEVGEGTQIFEFFELTIPTERARLSTLSQQVSRSFRSATIFVNLISRFANRFGPSFSNQSHGILQRLLNILDSALIQLTRRQSVTLGRSRPPAVMTQELISAFSGLRDLLSKTDIGWPRSPEVVEMVMSFQEHRLSPPRTPRKQ